ncbi:MAG: hypothetical protein H6922_04385 [Pseudomonadaceae bacterium]|nr:hypothetical protein [Pseudomonadaceae bacterium]
MTNKPLFLLPLLLLAATGCTEGWKVRNVLDYPAYEGVGYTNREPTEREKLIAKSDFSVELVRFEDVRRPRSTVPHPRDTVIYEYQPDELLQGIAYKAPVLLSKHMEYKTPAEKNYKVEVELEKLRTYIATGTILTGHFGQYTVELEARVLARRPDSQVVVYRPYTLTLTEKRNSFNARNPTKEMDRARMYDLSEDAFRRLSEDVMWDLRQFDARRWDIVSEKREAAEAEAALRAKAEAEAAARAAAQPAVSDDMPTTIEELVRPEAPETAPAPLYDDRLGV